jgi:type III secretion protein C
MNRLLGRLLVAAAVLLGAAGAHAATPPWPSAPFQYFAKRYAIPKVLGDFAAAFGLKLVLDPQVQGQVDGNYAAGSPSQFLDTLAASYGLTWYYRNGTLYIDRASESTSRTLHVGRGEVDALKQALESLGIFDARFGWGEFADRGVVIVSGPPSYVAAVSDTVDELGLGPAGNEELRIFPLKHARAEDRTFSYRDQQVTTPGVATILRGLVGGGGAALGTTTTGPAAAGAVGTPPTPAEAPLSATGAARGADADAGGAAGAAGAAHGGGLAVGPAPAPASRHVVIQADQRLNAVIVRDSPEHMASYEQLIRQLDVPTPLIEIEAMIVDVDTDKLDSLGVNWAGRKAGITAGFGDVSADPTDTTITLAKGTNINQGSLLANTAGFFLSQVNALASRGEARIIGRPSVLTTDNLVAVLDLSQTFYVRTTGERVAQLTPVTTGTLLKVTPRIVDDHDKRMVQLTVDIEDGTVNTDAPVDTLPTVTQSTISTQAVILEDDSLLIGGYILESDSSKRAKVPLLGDLPGIGALFRTDTRTGTRRERMFLIRPRIVRNPADPASGRPLPPVVLPPAPGKPGSVDAAYDRRTDAVAPAAR